MCRIQAIDLNLRNRLGSIFKPKPWLSMGFKSGVICIVSISAQVFEHIWDINSFQKYQKVQISRGFRHFPHRETPGLLQTPLPCFWVVDFHCFFGCFKSGLRREDRLQVEPNSLHLKVSGWWHQLCGCKIMGLIHIKQLGIWRLTGIWSIWWPHWNVVEWVLMNAIVS